MTTSEIKSEIQKALDNLPENVLENILSYLKEVQRSSGDQLKLSRDLSKILTEDKELLNRLAK